MLKDNLNRFVITSALLLATSGINGQFITKQNLVLEWSYHTSKAYPNPFMDVEITALIKDDKGNTIKLPGFWKGKGEWAFRFSSPETGTYSFLTECSDRKNRDLNNRKGTISVVTYDGENVLFREGALRISKDKRHFEHLSGKPFFWLADSWWFGMSRRISCFPGKVAPWGLRPVVQNIEKDINYAAKWIDPLTGEEYPIGDVVPDSEGKWRIPFATILHDWVLVMEKI